MLAQRESSKAQKMIDQVDAESQIWVLEPTWQNFSSMYREAICAQEASSGMEVSHHRMAALYFGISTLECLLNREMTRNQLNLGMKHDEIHELLRKSDFKKKIKTWPKIITGHDLSLRPDTLKCILETNDLRGNLTHLKNYWPDTFDDLGRTDPLDVVELVAEYICALHQAKGELFPYWIWGWNYLSPNSDGYQISLLPYSQFFHSLRSLGYKFERQASYGSDEREREILADFGGYKKVVEFLRSRDQCERKWDRFPYQPKLCRRWWDPVHQKSCGAAISEAVAQALEIDKAYGRRFRAEDLDEATDPPAAQTWMQWIKDSMKRWRW